MNPNLIKQGIDGEAYSHAAPTIGTTMLAHFSTPERHRADIYEVDCGFFTDRPGRSIYIRPALAGEYDLESTDAPGVERPMLWVSVHQLAPGLHMILPVWRGAHTFWTGVDVSTDEGVGRTILTMCLRGGLHLSEWMSYIYDCRVQQDGKQHGKLKKRAVN